MSLKDISNGPDWGLWVTLVVLAVMSVIMLTGHGAGLIAGYNTARKEEKSKYDEKKLCRVTGSGMTVITVLVLIMGIWQVQLPASFATVFLVVTVVDCIVMMILMNTICRK